VEEVDLVVIVGAVDPVEVVAVVARAVANLPRRRAERRQEVLISSRE